MAGWPCDPWLFQTEFHLLLGPPFAKPKKGSNERFCNADVKGKAHLQFPSLKHFGALQKFVTGRAKPDMLVRCSRNSQRPLTKVH